MEDLGHSFQSSTIQRMELTLLEALGWCPGSTTAYSCIELLLWSIDSLKHQLHEECITRVTKLLVAAVSGIFIIVMIILCSSCCIYIQRTVTWKLSLWMNFFPLATRSKSLVVGIYLCSCTLLPSFKFTCWYLVMQTIGSTARPNLFYLFPLITET